MTNQLRAAQKNRSHVLELVDAARTEAETALADTETPMTLRQVRAAEAFAKLKVAVRRLGVTASQSPVVAESIEKLAMHYRQIDSRKRHQVAADQMALQIAAELGGEAVTESEP